MESQESPRAANGRRDDNGSPSIGEAVDRVSGSAQHAWTRTRDAFDDIKGTLDLEGRVKRHPYGTLAAAIGVGYVLGGGLFSRLTARILGLGLRVGIRLAAIPVLKDELAGFADSFGAGEGGGGGPETGARRRKTRQGTQNKDKETEP